LSPPRNLHIDKVRHERVVSIGFTQDMEVLDVVWTSSRRSGA
jgi:hypothetical protein